MSDLESPQERLQRLHLEATQQIATLREVGEIFDTDHHEARNHTVRFGQAALYALEFILEAHKALAPDGYVTQELERLRELAKWGGMRVLVQLTYAGQQMFAAGHQNIRGIVKESEGHWSVQLELDASGKDGVLRGTAKFLTPAVSERFRKGFDVMQGRQVMAKCTHDAHH